MNESRTINPSAPDIIYTSPPVLTRQQRRHAQEEVDYRQAIEKQGKHLIRGYRNNPKYPSHMGAKQMAKLVVRMGGNT